MIKTIPKRLLPALTLASLGLAVGAHRSQAGPLTSAKAAFDAQMQLVEGQGGSGVAELGAPIFALIVLVLIIFIIVTLGLAAFDGGGQLPLAERIKNILVPAVFITLALGIVGALVTWVAAI